jgi:hypothetical protein
MAVSWYQILDLGVKRRPTCQTLKATAAICRDHNVKAAEGLAEREERDVS